MRHLSLSAGSAEVVVDAVRGGRIAALRVSGRPLMFSGGGTSLQWGSYPMVPWAGRVADGRFEFRGDRHQLPCNLPPHSAHGVGYTLTWDVVDERTIACEMGDPWPFGGRVEQTFDLDADGLTIGIEVQASRAMPLMVGWHPWFNRFLGGPDGRPVEAVLDFVADQMYELDERAIPTGRLVEPPAGPWDNCFSGVRTGPTITWPDLLTLRLSSSCDHWVVYTEPGHALCVEPQSAAPDAFNRDPMVLAAGQRHHAWFRLDWEEPNRRRG